MGKAENKNGDSDGGAIPHAIARETFHFHSSTMRDSISVQKRHNYVNDDEEHEEDPHLEDFLIPHRVVHVKTGGSVNTVTEDGPAEEEAVSDDETTSTSVQQQVHDPAHSKKPNLVRPCRSILHRPPQPPAERETSGSTTVAEQKRPGDPRVKFHNVIVRDYGMILGDHPNCSYGPPVTIEWDYLEYEPIDVDEYEFHHARRRTMRMMLMNYYRRVELLTMADHTEKEWKEATKAVNRVKLQRCVTRQLLPVRRVEDAMESACRKFKRAVTTSTRKKKKKASTSLGLTTSADVTVVDQETTD